MIEETKQKRTSLGMADADVKNVRELPPLAESFPNSAKVEETDLSVPFRVISLSDGEPSIKVYDTTGPANPDVRTGLPKRRAAWVAPRRGGANVTQMHYARQGLITEEMRFCAIRENVEPEF